jgi:hypothetical protein
MTEKLDLLGVIQAHLKWKQRLSDYIDGTGSEQLNASEVGKDSTCTLGQWIYGPGGEEFGETECFRELVEIHAKFHQLAGEVVRLVDKGDHRLALALLNEGDYAATSQRIKSKLARLSRELSL